MSSRRQSNTIGSLIVEGRTVDIVPEGLNSTFIALIPKVDCPQRVADFRNSTFIAQHMNSILKENEVQVSHLQFADDTLLVGAKNWANVRALKAVLVLFESVSGLKVNFHKSLPIGGDARKLQFWYPLVDRIRKRLSGWKCKNLSFGGRLILLKYVMSSILVYFLSFFKAPSDSIRRKVGDGRNTSFWLDPWLDDGPLQRSFSRLFELSENKEAMVADMIVAGSGVGGETWQWRRRLYA
ncbi:hypothetical protein TSUD_405540 [Trifolium subterraneum]|uniref:Reverse transcriptase domain-containing protein n=1 Tax=Trifolium subterraneum TaxID=3900 RepID=A0A2Z6NWA0_TRISU|nr:hypothetical protein TSUD_405540 [Trifolium subterraneum]